MLYKELQPADLYMIRLPYSFSDYDRQLLTLFYQPLVGAEGISLYLTLWADGELRNNEQWPHYQLMNVLGVSIGKDLSGENSSRSYRIASYMAKVRGRWPCFLLRARCSLRRRVLFKGPSIVHVFAE